MTDFGQAVNAMMEKINSENKMVLATRSGDGVAARTVSIVVHDNAFYFQTGIDMAKAKEIEKCSNVALCFKSIEIKGICTQIGKPTDESNKWFVEAFKELYPSAYEKYSHLEQERIYKVTPNIIKIWEYQGDLPGIQIINFDSQSVGYQVYSI